MTAFIGIISVIVGQECETPFDFNECLKEGSPDGSWVVSGTHNVISESYILPATFIASQNILINVLIKGTMTVESSTDNEITALVPGNK